MTHLFPITHSFLGGGVIPLRKMLCVFLTVLSLQSFGQSPNERMSELKDKVAEQLQGTWAFNTIVITHPNARLDATGKNLERVTIYEFKDNWVSLRISEKDKFTEISTKYTIQIDEDIATIVFKKLRKENGCAPMSRFKILSMEDSVLLVESCSDANNSIEYRKLMSEADMISHAATNLQGEWIYEKTTKSAYNIGLNGEILFSNPVDSLISYLFKQDSVFIQIETDSAINEIRTTYSIRAAPFTQLLGVHIDGFTRESCDPFPVLYIERLSFDKMELIKCDHDHYRVLYQKQGLNPE